MGIGNSFITEVKTQPVSKRDSRHNLHLNQNSAEGRINKTQSPSLAEHSPPQHMNFTMMSGSATPNAPQNMLVSFNFLTQVPIDEFILQENSKASKMSARLRNTASMKITYELNQKIKEK